MPKVRSIDPRIARRFIITKQHLDGGQHPTMLDVIRDLGCVQLDPISKVARTHLLVMWSRLGIYDVADFDKLRWEDRSLFEYWAHAASLVLTEDYPIHAAYMREVGHDEKIPQWIAEHNLQPLREYMLQKIRENGPLGTNDFEDDQLTSETFSGWTSGRAVNRLMDRMWSMGNVMVVERKGNQRKWDLAERFFPDWTPREELDSYQASYRSMQRAVKTLGIAQGRKQINYAFTRGRYWHYNKVLQQLLDEGKLIPITIESWDNEWLMHVDDLSLLEQIEKGEWIPKTTLLSPFDNLICDRDRTEFLWDFRFRIEIYVPKAKREYGYYVLPILHGDQLIGRMDMDYDKKAQRLDILATYAEESAPQDAVDEIRAAVHSLGDFLGAKKIAYSKKLPAIWSSLKK